IDDLKDIFSDFAELTRQRNEFVHWIWSWNTETHEDRIDPPGYKPMRQGRYVKPKDVSEVANNLVWIEHRLAAHLLTRAELNASIKKYGLAGALTAPTPWLEKLPLPDPKQPNLHVLKK